MLLSRRAATTCSTCASWSYSRAACSAIWRIWALPRALRASLHLPGRPDADTAPDRLVFVGPAPAARSSGGGPFDFFGVFSALRAPSTPPTGLFVASVEASGVDAARPRRIGTANNRSGRSGGLRMPCTVLRARTTARWRSARPTRLWRDARPGCASPGQYRAGCRAGRPVGYTPWPCTPARSPVERAEPVVTALQAWLVSFVSAEFDARRVALKGKSHVAPTYLCDRRAFCCRRSS